MINSGLIIAGSDSSAGAGIQADLKTFSSLKTYVATVITCITAQNTTGISYIEEVSPKLIFGQLKMVHSDLKIKFIKIGMMYTLKNCQEIYKFYKKSNKNQYKIILDPVLISKSNNKLLEKDAINVLSNTLGSICYLITPNIYEAEILSKLKIKTISDVKKAAKAIFNKIKTNVLIKGGHLTNNKGTDILYDGTKFYTFNGEVYNDRYTHGAGCTLSSAITAYLIQGNSLIKSIELAKIYVTKAIKTGVDIGSKNNPLNHLGLSANLNNNKKKVNNIIIESNNKIVNTNNKRPINNKELAKEFISNFAELRKKKFLILNLTNIVTINLIADSQISIGCSPVMSCELNDALWFSNESHAILINIGTTNTVQDKIFEEVAISFHTNRSIILDLVGYGTSASRNNIVNKLLSHVNVVKGNYGEILYLINKDNSMIKGVDFNNDNAELDFKKMKKKIISYAKKNKKIVLATGAVDIISDGREIYSVSGGSLLLKSFSGSGCLVGSMATCLSSINPGIKNIVQASWLVKKASEKAELICKQNPYFSFKQLLIDQIGLLSKEKQIDLSNINDEKTIK